MGRPYGGSSGVYLAAVGARLPLTSEMNRVRELGRTGYEPGLEDRERTQASAWVPNADVFARGEDLAFRMELAGVDRDDIEITLHDNTLTVSGERENDLDEDVMF